MTTPRQRSAAAALDEARPVMARLDVSAHPEELAANLIDGWNLTQNALRALVGSSALSGQALIRELRQRELLTLDQAHALVEFSAANDRVQRTEYRPTGSDVAAARAGFQQLEAALLNEPPTISSPPPRDPAPVIAEAPIVETVPTPPLTPVALARSRWRDWRVLTLVAVLVLSAVGGGTYYLTEIRSGAAAMRTGRAAYAAGDHTRARNAFTAAVRENPDLAEAHVYLGRMAREEGDVQTAGRELASAIQLDPNSALAQREMGAHLLASGKFDLARRFYVRAVELDPSDRSAVGFLGCTLIKLGRIPEGMRFLGRAGQGSWSSCAPPPGFVPGGAPGQLPGAPPRPPA